MNSFEQLALWYLRLNGYFVIPNFIAHGDGGPRTDVDVLGVRFPHSREYPDDAQRLQIPPNKVDIVFAESKAGRCKLNGPWKNGGDRQALEYVLRRVGIFESDNSIHAAATRLYAEQRQETGDYLIRIVCFGSKTNGTLARVTQVLWPDVLSFINRRFETYLRLKAEHQHWDSFGKYLWDRLGGDVIPEVKDIVKGWETRCNCWPEQAARTTKSALRATRYGQYPQQKSEEGSMDALGRFVADAVLGIDTLWGGDVMCPSGTGRFIADSWFSDEPLPAAYKAPAAARVRASGGVASKNVDRQAVEEYLGEVDLPQAIAGVRDEAGKMGGMRAQYLLGLSLCLETMWDLAMEVLGKGKPVPYLRCVEASTGRPPEASNPEAKRERVAELLGRAGYATSGSADLLGAVDAWRRDRLVPMASVRALGAAMIAHFDRLSALNLLPYLPQDLVSVPRANIEFLPIKDAWFSGSMNYLGRARKADGRPQYEATYEINASLQISVPEFEQLVSHEVVPGHVTTFAYLQDLYIRGKVNFEATVLTMNTRSATLFEGIANNAILIAHGVTEIEQLPDEDLQIGVLLALLQDDAKNQSSYLTWGEGAQREKVAAHLRRDFLVTEERADKLSGAWGQHPLLGRMYLPAYRAGTERVAQLRRIHPPDHILPAIYGCSGLADIVTIDEMLKHQIA